MQAANIEADASGTPDGEYQLSKHEFSNLGRGKYSGTSDIHCLSISFFVEKFNIFFFIFNYVPHISFRFSECSTTESSDDIEKQELEEVSDDDEISFYDTREFFTEPSVSCRPVKEVTNHAREEEQPGNTFNTSERMYDEKEKCDSKYPNIERRKKLPDPVEKERGVSLWSMIKDNVGKDLTRVCLPVYFNEPISSLQKCFEDLEYSYLLDRAYEYGKAVRLKFMNSQCLVSHAPEFMYLHW